MKESVAIAKEADTKKGFSATKSDKSVHRVQTEPERQLDSLRGVIGNIRRDGGTPSVGSIATELSGIASAQRASVLLALQQTHGNRYVQRVVAGIQTKLKVGQLGDVYEQEADRVAEQVMRMPEPKVERQAEEDKEEELIQTKPLAPQITPLVQRQVEEEEEEEETLRAKETSDHSSEVNPDLESRIQALKGDGQPLPQSERAFFEPRFDYDFSSVRVRTDIETDVLSRALNARAFTAGRDIFFRQGAYNPSNWSGRELIAHELTHVVQQNGNKVQRKLTVGQPGDKYKQEADQVARAVMQQEQRPVQRKLDGGLVRRQIEEEEEEVQKKSEYSKVQQQVEENEEEEPVQAKAEDVLVQGQMDEKGLIQTKSIGALIPPLVQRQDVEEQEEESIQAKAITERIAPFVARKIEKGELVQPKLIRMQRTSSTAPAQLASRQQQPEAQKEPEKLKIERLDLHPYPAVIFNRRASLTERWNHLFASRAFGKAIRHKQCYLPSHHEAVKASGADPEECRTSQVVYTLAFPAVPRITNVINFPGDSWELAKPYIREQIRNRIKYMESEEGQKKQEEQKKAKTQKKLEYIRTLFERYVTETRDMNPPTKRIQCLLGKLVQPEVDDRYIPPNIILGLYNLAKHGAQQKTKEGIRPYPGTQGVQHLAVGEGPNGTLSKEQLDSVFRANAREFVGEFVGRANIQEGCIT